MPEAKWDLISTYVYDVVARATPQVTYSASQLYPAVARLAEFANDNYIPLEDDTVFDPFTVGRFVTHHFAGYNRASRNTMRARLRRVSEALLGDDAKGKFKTIGKGDASRPYSPSEVATLEGWSRAQTSEERRTSATALLALGLGGGLTGAEIIEQRVEDLDVSGESCVIHVAGAMGRDVPVLQAWVAPLLCRAEFLGGSGWVFRAEQRGGNINLISDFVSRTKAGIPLQARRMRATWIAHHLEIGTPLKGFLRMSGLQSAEALDRILPFVSE